MPRRWRLWARLVRLAVRAARHPHQFNAVVSEAEAIHRDLGHTYNAALIRPEPGL